MPIDHVALYERHRRCWELHVLEGKSFREIGQLVGIAWSTAREDCLACDRQMMDALADKADEWRAKHVRMKMIAASECWKAWRESHHRIEKLEKARSVKDKDGDTMTQELIRQEKLGSVQFLSEMRAQLESIERIVPGMIAPTTHELTGKGGRPLFPLEKFDELFERDDFADILSGRKLITATVIPSPGGNGNGSDNGGAGDAGQPLDAGLAGGDGKPGPLEDGSAPGDH